MIDHRDPIHDHYCRCRSCKPAQADDPAHPFGSVIAPHRPVSPAIRRAMDRIVFALLLFACVCTTMLAMAAHP